MPYSDVPREQLILRDILAIHRTTLANERTLLAYVRTALTSLITGIGLIKFFESTATRAAGWLFVAITVVTLSLGFQRFRKMKRSVDLAREPVAENRSHQGPDQ